MSIESFGARLRAARLAAGFHNGDDAWLALKAVYRRTPSRSTFLRLESDPDAERRANPAVFAIYCEHVLGVDPSTISVELGDAIVELRRLVDVEQA